MNSPVNSISLAQLNHKAIILDFGSLSCGVCIESLPRLNQLQAKYKNDLQIFWVTEDSPERLKKFIATNRVVKGVKIPILANAKQLYQYFPPEGGYVPAEVWIGSDGTVKAFTRLT